MNAIKEIRPRACPDLRIWRVTHSQITKQASAECVAFCAELKELVSRAHAGELVLLQLHPEARAFY